uniref:DDHD domain-containing protein n=1 Tax=Macrostomum lignano TaxID=282301 RepID=A0A1I8JM68_9PLAT
MLVKEYRICMPLTVAEYRIAQLYMIQKKSREESTGSGSGVEIIINEPYENGPGGRGQYTFKIYHIGSHLPAWFRAILPKSALRVEEEAWNAYPYTKTRYKCPFVEKFLLEIETVYRDDGGDAENVFGLEGNDLARQVDYIDIVRDWVDPGHYHRDEDPRLFVSKATGRGPLADDWRRNLGGGGRVMCSYKLCRVEFRYWGMQTKIERFIHDVALRKTMLRAHRQAWAWQDEWVGLSIDDIRRLEAETAAALQARMAAAALEEAGSLDAAVRSPASASAGDACAALTVASSSSSSGHSQRLPASPAASAAASTTAATAASGNSHLSEHLASATVHVAVDAQSDADPEFDALSISDEYFDARSEIAETASFATCASSYTLVNSRSSTLTSPGPPPPPPPPPPPQELPHQRPHQHHHHHQQQQRVLFLVLHGGSVLDTNHEYHNKHADASTLRSCLNAVAQSSPAYRRLRGRFAVRLVSSPPLVAASLQRLAAVSPYNYRLQRSSADASLALSFDHAPIATVPLLMTSTPDYPGLLAGVARRLNERRREFLATDEGKEFANARLMFLSLWCHSRLLFGRLCKYFSSVMHHLLNSEIYGTSLIFRIRLTLGWPLRLTPYPQVCLIGDSIGGIVGYDILASVAAKADADNADDAGDSSNSTQIRLDFPVADFFLLGCPLALLLTYRQLALGQDRLPRPACEQPPPPPPPPPPPSQPPATAQERIGCRLSRQNSGSSGCSGGGVDASLLELMQDVCQRWWGARRLDYSLHCPDSLTRFPVNAMPLLFHASYWESADAAAFILRQQIHVPYGSAGHPGGTSTAATSMYQSASSLVGDEELDLDRESGSTTPTPYSGAGLSFMSAGGSEASASGKKRLRRRLTGGVRLKHATANHRANDVIVTEGQSQVVTARFMYGPLDMLSLSDEIIDVHSLSQPPSGDWTYLGSGRTDSHGKLSFALPTDRRLPLGSHTLKLVARSDLTCADLNLAVVPPNTECVAFSIDGSFAASVSLMGGDPKVRPGSVDVARHWQDLGYLLLYVTARPDMQLRRVLGWLARHNFPHGMLFFADGLSADAMRQKAACLQRLTAQTGLRLHAAYGSAKDVPAFRAVGARHVFVVGRGGRKWAGLAT